MYMSSYLSSCKKSSFEETTNSFTGAVCVSKRPAGYRQKAMIPHAGLEPAAFGLKGRRSTNWANAIWSRRRRSSTRFFLQKNQTAYEEWDSNPCVLQQRILRPSPWPLGHPRFNRLQVIIGNYYFVCCMKPFYTQRESNPRQRNGSPLFYHWTMSVLVNHDHQVFFE